MSGQDWLEKDYYATLGVSKDADASAIKKAYRKLARTHHPDQNQGDPSAEAKFKDIGEAYAVLSDAEQRKQYDSLRAMAGGGPRFTAGAGGPTGGASFEDLFGGAFGGGGGRGGNPRFSTEAPAASRTSSRECSGAAGSPVEPADAARASVAPNRAPTSRRA